MRIDDIRVNGQQASGTAPFIAGFHPAISWDYVQDIASPSQVSFKIQIGTSSVNVGTGSFTADILDQEVLSSSNFYEYTEHNLFRGIAYNGQLQATDPDGDVTPWTAFFLTVNNLPFVTNFSLSPASPVISSDIELSYTYNDVDSHEEAGTKIRWFRNNISVSKYDDLCILPSTATLPNESWSAKIIPSDGIEFGAIVETGAVVIQNLDTTFINVSILPSDANVDDILKVEFDLAENEYIVLTGVVTYQWTVNGVEIPDTNSQFVRLDLEPGDLVRVILSLVNSDGELLTQKTSGSIEILDVIWHIFNLKINDLKDAVNLNDLSPILTWDIFKSTSADRELPAFLNVIITKTLSRDQPLFGTGDVQYTKNSYQVPDGILTQGQDHYIHIGISDTSPIPTGSFIRMRVTTAGSSWANNVDNSIGWSIEAKLAVTSISTQDGAVPSGENPRLGMYIHDGTYFASIIFEQNKVVFQSTNIITYNIPDSIPNLTISKTFRISAKENDLKIFMNNTLIIDATDEFISESQLKVIEYGDLDGKFVNEGTFRFVRFSTLGAFSFGDTLPNENTFLFHEVGKLKDGTISDINDNFISWLPDDIDESSKLIQFNENNTEFTLPTATKNFSPITAIYIDEKRNKYIGTANGVNSIHGEKHNPDYEFLTTDENVVITSNDFDRISTIDPSQFNIVEPDTKSGWFTIDTTVRSIGVESTERFATGDPYDPYKFTITSHAVHYYSQRVHGHSWYDQVDNTKGWQVEFTFDIDRLEQDDFNDQNIDHQGFGVFINDGTYQEVLYFYQDRIRLFHANVFVPISTKTARNYRIVGKGKDISIYQKLDISAITTYQKLVDGAGLFTIPSSVAGNSRRPRMKFDSAGLYHCVWHDDGNGRSQIFYSLFDGSDWSSPEIVAGAKFNLRNPDLDIDSDGRVWVVYEDTSWGKTEISVSVKDGVGWNKPTRITNNKSNKFRPAIMIDSFNNVNVVWEDDRNGNSQIFWAERQNSTQAWISSAQFGEDTVIVQENDNNDPYVAGALAFKNPRMAYLHPNIWLVTEGKEADHTTAIYLGSRNVETGVWNSSGVPALDDDGNVFGTKTSSVISPINRDCFKPQIATHGNGVFVVVWEDQTEPLSQVWGRAFNNLGLAVVDSQQITSRTADAKDPVVGFVKEQAAIVFESENSLYVSNYNSVTFAWFSSNTGGTDNLLLTNVDYKPANPAISNFVPADNTIITYDFLRTQSSLVEDVEFPDYYLIGDVRITHKMAAYPTDVAETDTTGQALVSNIDTKEFAFGDMSENVGILAHWKDIKMYFGYDAHPTTIGIFNSSTVDNWPSDRINDIFVDVFGNLVVATFGGLVYHNVFTGQVVNIEGRTSSFNSEIGCTPETCLLKGKLTTAVAWGKNGAWYVGATDGLYLSTSAGKFWNKFPNTDSVIIHSIDIDRNGSAVCGTDQGVLVAKPDLSTTLISVESAFDQVDKTNVVQSVGVDDADIIWAGTVLGLIRIENQSSFLLFNRKSGMRSGHVTDISIVNKHVRFIATANGIDRMNGTSFENFSTQTHELINNNISKIQWFAKTNSLWVASLHSLHEIVFRDSAHESILDEVVQYDSTELLSDSSFEQKIYTVLDIEELQEITDLELRLESATVLLNKNDIDFGFNVDDFGKTVAFVTDLLSNDEVELFLSNKFVQFHDFNQTAIEKKILGPKRTIIQKTLNTFTHPQLLLLSGGDKDQVLMFGGESNLPFTTILLDRDLPVGCFKHTDTLTPTSLKFKILASDALSGIDKYVLSNFENFTSDGTLPIDFQALPSDGVVTHDIGSGLNQVTTSLEFPATTSIDSTTIVIGGEGGARLDRWTDIDNNITYLYAATSGPVVVWRFDPTLETWASVVQLNADTSRDVTDMLEFNNVLFISTGSDSDVGVVYRTTNGTTFDVIATTTATHFTSMAAALDGNIYFADNNGSIFEYKDGISAEKITNIGNEINDIHITQNLLVAATGNKGRIYLINLETDDNLIIFSGNETDITSVHIKDTFLTSTPADAKVYIGSGDSTTIYRGNLDTFDFIKSFSSFNKDINTIRTVDKSALGDEGADTIVVAAVGDSLFKHIGPSWEFFFQNDEEITDFFQYGQVGQEGIYVMSDTKITKWTSNLATKTVFLKLKDKSGNISEAPTTDPLCPTNPEDFCCNYAYSLNIVDLKGFIHESRIVDIDEYGTILFTYDSPNDRSFYSADEIDEEIGIYTSEIFNGSNDLVSWKAITWDSVEPANTSVNLQIRNGATEDSLNSAEWGQNLIKNADDEVSLEHVTDQYLQFRAVLNSRVRDISPSLTSVTIRSLTTKASHFFTTNFILDSRPVKGIMTANTFIPVSADIIFGINTKDSVEFTEYQIIEPNRIFSSGQTQFGDNFRIGAKLLSPAIPQLSATDNPGDPYDASSYTCIVNFDYTNIDVKKDYHFRVKFFNDLFRTQLIHTFFTGNDQTGWSHGSGSNNFPALGLAMDTNQKKNIKFEPKEAVETNQKWYLIVEAYDGTTFETVSDDQSFICSDCNITNEANLVSEYYKTGLPSGLTTVPKFSDFNPDFTLLETIISFAETSGDWVTSKGQNLSGFSDNFAARFRGRIQAPSSGVYTFELQSNDGSRLFINADEIIDHDGAHDFTTKTGQVTLSAGFHDIEIQYFAGTGAAGIELRWIEPGQSTAAIVPLQRLFHAVVSEYCAITAPRIFNFAVQFELEDGQTVKLNLTP